MVALRLGTSVVFHILGGVVRSRCHLPDALEARGPIVGWCEFGRIKNKPMTLYGTNLFLHFQCYIGSQSTPPIDARLDVTLRVLQLVCSSLIVVSWIYKSYAADLAHTNIYSLEVLACVGCLAQLAFRVIKSGFSFTYMTSIEIVFDCFTLSPLFLQRAGPMFGGSFVTLSYLRVYWVLSAFNDLADEGFLEPYISDMSTAVLQKLIEFVAVIFAIAGTFWILEGLGDLPFLQDTYIDSGMGEISFLQSRPSSF